MCPLWLRPAVLFFFSTSAAWGYTPLQDQQLGGILMWVPGIVLFLWVGLRAIQRVWSNLEELNSV